MCTYLFPAFKIVYYNNYESSITMFCTREKKYLCHFLFGDKIIKKRVKKDWAHSYDNALLLKRETQKKISYPGSWYHNNKKKLIFDISSLKDTFFTKSAPNDLSYKS